MKGFMGFRRLGHDIELGTDMQQLDPLPEERDGPGTPVVAGVAVFEAIDAAQAKPSIVVAHQPQRTDGNRVVEKLQALIGAGTLRCLDADFAHLQAVQPEPDSGSEEYQDQQLEQFHHASIRKP